MTDHGMDPDATSNADDRDAASTSDLTNQRFGYLTVLYRAARTPRRVLPGIYWICQCRCGTTPVIRADEVLSGAATSCGICSHSETVRREGRRSVADATATRVCTRCRGEAQPFENFGQRWSDKYGRDIICKRCRAVAAAQRRARKKGDRDDPAQRCDT